MTFIISWGFAWGIWTPKHSQTTQSLREKILFGIWSPWVGQVSKHPQELRLHFLWGKLDPGTWKWPFTLHNVLRFWIWGLWGCRGPTRPPRVLGPAEGSAAANLAVWGNTDLDRQALLRVIPSFHPGLCAHCEGQSRPHIWTHTWGADRHAWACRPAPLCAVPRTFTEVGGQPQSLHLVDSTPGTLIKVTLTAGKCGANLHFWGGWPASEECWGPASRQELSLGHQGTSPWPQLYYDLHSLAQVPGAFLEDHLKGTMSARSSCPPGRPTRPA